MDISNKTLKELLDEKMGPEKSETLLKHINKGYQKGLRGDDLKNHINNGLKKNGHDASDLSYGCAVIAVAVV